MPLTRQTRQALDGQKARADPLLLTLYYPILDYPAGIRVVRTVRHRSHGISRVRYDTFRADAFFAGGGGQQIWSSAYSSCTAFPVKLAYAVLQLISADKA